MMQLTEHAERRSRQRSLPNTILELIQEHGRVSPAPGGVEEIFFGKKEINTLRQQLKNVLQLLDKSERATMIVKDDTIITVYKASAKRQTERKALCH